MTSAHRNVRMQKEKKEKSMQKCRTAKKFTQRYRKACKKQQAAKKIHAEMNGRGDGSAKMQECNKKKMQEWKT